MQTKTRFDRGVDGMRGENWDGMEWHCPNCWLFHLLITFLDLNSGDPDTLPLSPWKHLYRPPVLVKKKKKPEQTCIKVSNMWTMSYVSPKYTRLRWIWNVRAGQNVALLMFIWKTPQWGSKLLHRQEKTLIMESWVAKNAAVIRKATENNYASFYPHNASVGQNNNLQTDKNKD